MASLVLIRCTTADALQLSMIVLGLYTLMHSDRVSSASAEHKARSSDAT
jgi:hypothetical protein